jgi:hypothetical protein
VEGQRLRAERGEDPPRSPDAAPPASQRVQPGAGRGQDLLRGESRGGMISVGHNNGAVFTAVLPECVGVA